MSEHRKRAAFESATALARPVDYDPNMARPSSTVAGGVLVILRALAGFAWIANAWVVWNHEAARGDLNISGVVLQDADEKTAVLVMVAGLAVLYLAELALGVLIIRGSNLARVWVMIGSVVSISAAWIGWWSNGQSITLQTTFVTLSLDILVLLALSSRSSAAFSRRRERKLAP